MILCCTMTGAEHEEIKRFAKDLAKTVSIKRTKSTMETTSLTNDLVEKIVTNLIGNVDNSPVSRIYNHKSYNQSGGDARSLAYTALRDLVERAVEEARKLPGLGNSGAPARNHDEQQRDVSDRIYEDLLATAILNKVIEKYQIERLDGNRNVLSQKHAEGELEVGLDEGVEEGSSSLEALSQDDCSSECSGMQSKHSRNRRRSQPLSLTIEERIEEITTYTNLENDNPLQCENTQLDLSKSRRVPFPEFGMDIIDPSQESDEEDQDETDSQAAMEVILPTDSWEDNWLFRKTKIQIQSEPVAMLVPNPSIDFKALIGDKDADEISDLSECSPLNSDEEIEAELKVAIKNVVPKSLDEDEVDEDDSVSSFSRLDSDSFNLDDNEIDEKFEELLKENESANATQTSELTKLFLKRERNFDLSRISSSNSNSNHNGAIPKTPASTPIEVAINGKQNTNFNALSLKEKLDSIDKNSSSSLNCDNKAKKVFVDSSNGDPTWTVNGKLKTDYPDNSSIGKNYNGDGIRTAKMAIIVDDSNEMVNGIKEETGEECEFSENPVSPIKRRMNSLKRQAELSSLAKEKINEDENDSKCLYDNNSTVVIKINGEVLNNKTLSEERKSLLTNGNHNGESLDENTESLPSDQIIIKEDLRHVKSSPKDVTVPIKIGEPVANGHLPNGSINAAEKSEGSELLEELNNMSNGTSAKKTSVSKKKIQQHTLVHRTPEKTCATIEENGSEEELDLFTPPRPGTIAEREHKKWENALPIENNPYSEENIQKRLIEKQYRRAAEMSGAKSDLPSAPTETIIVLRAKPDLQRFKRDYYINDSKSPSGQKRSPTPGSSRPTSSLSQNSSSSCSDLLTQESHNSGFGSSSPKSEDASPKFSKWHQKNNADSSQVKLSPATIHCIQKDSLSKVEEFLENERKNNKNEINAKLNNHGDVVDSLLIDKKSSTAILDEDNKKKIRRIDLKAYGFEKNQLTQSSENISASKRVVNKLDLKSLGYENGLRRCQSINHIDEKKVKGFESCRKSTNLQKSFNDLDNKKYESISYNGPNKASHYVSNKYCYPGPKLNDLSESRSDRLSAAKSVPNMADYHLYEENEESHNDVRQNAVSRSSTDLENSDSTRFNDSSGELSFNSDVDRSIGCSTASMINYVDNNLQEDLSMLPSVKRLAQSFNSSLNDVRISPEIKKIPQKSRKAESSRMKTPDVLIIQSPRQMHSLTARSLSKEFREGLKLQVSNRGYKQQSNPSPLQTNKTDKSLNLENIKKQIESSNKSMNGAKSSEKLRNNIEFWEKLQKQN